MRPVVSKLDTERWRRADQGTPADGVIVGRDASDIRENLRLRGATCWSRAGAGTLEVG
jgi:hypothetical protein